MVACDFDGTITLEDLGVATMERFAKGDWWAIETAWREGKISSIECLQRQFAMVDAPIEQLEAFYRTAAADTTFPPFVRECEARGVDVVVLSDGLDFYIDIVLAGLGLSHLPRLANHVNLDRGGFEIEFPHRAPDCERCGNCKRDHVRRLAGTHDVVAFVGDGHSDRCVVRHARPIFAKAALRDYCLREQIPFTPFDRFADLMGVPATLCGRPS